MIFNPVYGGDAAASLGSKTITENGTYLASSDNLDGYDEVTVNVSADPKIYTGEDEDYVFETAGELICTLSNRAYTKTTADKAYVAYFTSTGNYTQPILVSKIADGVKYTAFGSTFSYQGTFTYGGETYYYSKTEYAMSGNLTSTAGRGLKLTGTYASAQAAGEELLDVALGGGAVKFTANGSYPVPAGYDGYGDIEVNVSPTLQSKTGISITENGSFSFTPDSGYDGLSVVSGTVSVSGGGSANLYTNDTISPRGMYMFDTAGERLCTTNNRGYYKTTSDMAYGCYDANGSSSGPPFLISTIAAAVKYRADSGGPWDYGATFTYNGETWYISNTQHGWSGQRPNTNGPLKDYSFTDRSSRAAMGLEFLTYVLSLSDTPTNVYIPTGSGVLEPPTGYDGFGTIYIP